jgi:hypothetical protein
MITYSDTALASSGANATYILPSAQNELINAIFLVVDRRIVAEVKHARLFYLTADDRLFRPRKADCLSAVRH